MLRRSVTLDIRARRAYLGGREETTTKVPPMPLQTIANSPLSPRIAAACDLFFTERGLGYNPAELKRARAAELARLDALPDAALRAMGLTRARIPGYVFRDILPN